MKTKLLIAALAACVATSGAFAQAKKRIERADDLPRFTYPVKGKLEDVVRDPQQFNAFAAGVKRDTESVLNDYDIAENATKRQLLNVLALLAMLDGRYDDALRLADQIQALQDKPADKLLSGLSMRAIAKAAKKVGNRTSPEYLAEVGRNIAGTIEPMPYPVIKNDIEGSKASAELIGEALALGRVRNVLQPTADQTGALSSDLAPGIISARYVLQVVLPLKPVLTDTYTKYLAAHKVEKADIWAARDVALPPGMKFTPVKIAVWDSGVDTKLFPGQVVMDGDKPAMIAFDIYNKPTSAPLAPIREEVKPRLDSLLGRSKGLSDLQANIDSPEAQEIKKLLSSLTPEQYKPVIEELRMVGNYEHGTHVAGIALKGNPYASVANARLEFGYTLLPDPCSTTELEEKGIARYKSYADFIRRSGARVVNMSWGDDLRSDEVALEQCKIGKDAAERKAIARKWFDGNFKALKAAMESLPDVLFVAAAGNSGNDPTFNEDYPAAIVLPNLVVVGAVDKAGDEAPFTSYGPTVVLHANGYQVESFVPGGKRVALSGTSMASPQVANLAAKMLAVKPALKPAEIVDIMRKTADRSEDGRRTLVNPKKALEAVGYKG
ncbi:MAG TPA: S8 family serine peptidase [Ramlibacter sp.]|nr:S8 family serine peptidase [Ramlibacter sp.]